MSTLTTKILKYKVNETQIESSPFDDTRSAMKDIE